MAVNVGIGYDSHRFAEDRPLVLGGVEVEYERARARLEPLASETTWALLRRERAAAPPGASPPTWLPTR